MSTNRQDARPSWDNYFLAIAVVVAQRSMDAQTRHGCVLVDDENKIVGTGYNSFVKGIDDSVLPNTRPEKYTWMLHSEKNSLLNCHGKPTKCYVTGKCCLNCLQDLYQAGVKEVIMGAAYGWQSDDSEKSNWDLFVELTKMEVRFVLPDFTWMSGML